METIGRGISPSCPVGSLGMSKPLKESAESAAITPSTASTSAPPLATPVAAEALRFVK